MAKNIDTLLAAADYIELHPDEYDYGWAECVAAHVARAAGKTFIGPYIDDNGDAGEHVSDWARDYLGLDAFQADALFINQGELLDDEHDDAAKVAESVRAFVRNLTERAADV